MRLSAWPPYCIAPPSSASGTSFTATMNGTSYTFTLTNMYLLDLSNPAAGGDQVTELDGSGYPLHVNAWEGGHLSVAYDAKGGPPAVCGPTT